MSRILFLILLAIALFDQSLGALPSHSPSESFMCPISPDRARATFRCINGNQMTYRLPYLGVAPGVTVTLSGPGSTSVGGDDPAVTPDGTIELINLSPVSPYVVTISGGACSGTDAISYNFITPDYICGGDLSALINEVIPEPGSDTNGDGVNNFLEEQFVELYNPHPLVEIDMNGWNLIIGGVLRYTFPPQTIMGPNQAVTVFGGGFLTDPCHYSPPSPLFISSNGDIITLATPIGGSVHTMSFPGTSVPPNISLALNPDGNVAGGYVPHTTIVTNPVNYSPCFSNHLPGVVLPVALTSFSADYYKGEVFLNWATAREDHHAYFSLERSVDGRQWEAFQRVSSSLPAEDTGSEDNHYAAEDPAPPVGQVYYRLRQVDLDETSALYGPLSVTVPETTTAVSVYPNPARDLLWVDAPTTADKFSVIDVRGKEWLTGSLADGQATSINTSRLPAGVYLLRALKTNNIVSTSRWIKH